MTPLLLITQAVRWLHQHLTEALDTGTLIDYQRPTPPTQSPVLEIPLLCRALCEPNVARQLPAATRAKRDDMIRYVAQLHFTTGPGDDEASYPYHLVAVGLLAGCGIPIQRREHHHALARLGFGGLRSTTRPASAILEMRWAQRLIGFTNFDGVSDADLYRREVLAHDLDLMRMSDYEAYIATHVIFYLSAAMKKSPLVASSGPRWWPVESLHSSFGRVVVVGAPSAAHGGGVSQSPDRGREPPV